MTDTNDPNTQKIDRLSPDKLLATFQGSPMWKLLLIAVVLHVIIVLPTGWTTIYGWMNPQWQQQREQAAAQAEQEQADADAQGQTEGDDAASDDAGDTATAAAGDGNGEQTDEQMMEDRQDSQVIQNITEKANPEDIPDRPDTLGIGLDETN